MTIANIKHRHISEINIKNKYSDIFRIRVVAQVNYKPPTTFLNSIQTLACLRESFQNCDASFVEIKNIVDKMSKPEMYANIIQVRNNQQK